MTILEKIIHYITEGAVFKKGQTISPCDIKNSDKLSSDPVCGAFGALSDELLNDMTTIPESVFVNLDGALRDDASDDDVAGYIRDFLEKSSVEGLCIEFGGDSLTYLTMDDRFATVRELSRIKPFCVLFESDFNTALYLEQKGMRAPMFLNDGPENYKKVIDLSLAEI